MSSSPLQDGQNEFRVTGLVNVETVANYRDEMVARIKSADIQNIEIDLSSVDASGSAIIALLISLMREARKNGKRVTFIHSPDNLIAIAHACGVDGILGLVR